MLQPQLSRNLYKTHANRGYDAEGKNEGIREGVRRFVFSSVIHPVLSQLSNHAAKAPVEEAVLNSNLEYTFLHPTL